MFKWMKRIGSALTMVACFAALVLTGCTVKAGYEGAPSRSNPVASFLPIILIIILVYFLIIRPQNKKTKQPTERISFVEGQARLGQSINADGNFDSVKAEKAKARNRKIALREYQPPK